jgi:hypothetical protein
MTDLESFDIYFFRRSNKKNIPGYDQISIVAVSQDQAYEVLKELAVNPDEWNFSHVDFLAFDDED